MTCYLEYIHVGRFGGLGDRQIGPFGPGLNVVYGPNEAGKSTLKALVRGVLFDWEDASGVRNRYLPEEGGRSGSLLFSDTREVPDNPPAPDGSPDGSPALDESTTPTTTSLPAILSRDEGGMQGDESILADIDRETFDAVFSFSAEDLRSLRNSSDVTARLLTAVSGTGSSPSSAFVEIEQRIAASTLEIVSLTGQIEEARAQEKQASDQVELVKQEHRELDGLRPTREAAVERIDAINGDIEDLVAWRSELQVTDARLAELRADLDHLTSERREMPQTAQLASSIDPRLLELDSTGERVLRDRIDEYAERREKAERILDAAKENSASSRAAFEALAEVDDASARDTRKVTPPVVVSGLLTAVFIAAGIPLFMHGRQITSLSFTALGLGLVACAVLLAAVVVVLLLRPARSTSPETRRQDAQWVMLQDQKKLVACQEESDKVSAEIERFLDGAGLAAAGGSLRQARSLLDEAREHRSALVSADQRASSLDLRIRSLREQIVELERTRRRIEGDIGAPGATAREVDVIIRKRTAERDALLEGSATLSQRIGELSTSLDQAKRDATFTMCKYRTCELRTRLGEEKRTLIQLLLAKRMLERGIAAWESRSQPEVYDQASRLLTIITDGKWVRVTTSSTGSLAAVAADGVARNPRHLSLGTCQQLYLALRVALLMSAPEVGRAIPVLADDILVNFDAERRAGAARVLAELARTRQVIVFTCHRETAAALPTATRIDL